MSIERVSSILVGVAAVVVIGVYIQAWNHSHERGEAAGAESYAVGDTVAPLPSHEYGTSGRSLVAFIHSQCRFCTESMPFYKSLLDNRKGQDARVSIIAVSREPLQSAQAYAAAHGASFDRLLSIGSDSRFKLHVTPTLLGVDSRGEVRVKWIGFLNESDQAAVRAWLKEAPAVAAASPQTEPK